MKILDLLGLTELIDLIKDKYASITHTHKISDITDYSVDSSLSASSTNPVQNKVINEALLAFSTDVDNIEADIQKLQDEKADTTDIPTKVSQLTNDSGYITSAPVTSVNGKTGVVTLSASDIGADTSGSASAVQSNLDLLNDEFDDHVADTTAHMTSTQKSQLTTAYNHSQAAHARTDATKVAESSTNGNILINGTETNVYTHPTGTNPHGTTKADIGLGNVNNTSDANKPVSTAQKAAIDAVQANLDAVDDKVDDHIADGDIHFTATERTKLAGIATGANKYTHPSSGVSAGTYKSVTVNANGHVTGGTNPTTLSGYGITDAEAKGTVSTHNSSSSAHSDIRLLISDLSTKVTNFLDVDDTTKDELSEIIALIENNQDLIEGITTSKVNVADIINNLTTNVSNKPLSAAQGVALKKLIDDLQTALDTDEANLSTHTGNTTIHITATERTNWNDAVSKEHTHDNKSVLDSTTASYTTAEKTKLSGIATGAEVNQNAFSNITVGSTTIAADSKTDTLTLAGSNVTITPDATNDKLTFTVANGTTSAKGVVQLTNSTSSTSTTTAATPSSVKSAYDLANTAKTNAATAQETADSKVGSVTLASGTNNGTVKLTVDGVATDNIAVKGLGSAAYTASSAYATSGHTHSYAGSSSVGGAATSANKLNTNAGDSNTPVYFSNGIPVSCTSLDLNTTGSAYKTYTFGLNSSGSHDANSGYWNPFTWTISGSWSGVSGVYVLYDSEGTFNGTFSIKVRTGTTATTHSAGVVKWLSASHTPPTLSLTYVTDSTNVNTVYRLYITIPGTYRSYHIGRIGETISGSGGVSTATSSSITTTFTGTKSSDTSQVQIGGATVGSSTKPMYLNAGVPTACTYTLGKSVPSDAVFTDTVYTHPTTAGNKHIPSGGSSGQLLGYSSSGTAQWVNPQNAFSNIAVGSTTIAADSKADTLTFAGSNVTLTPDATNDKLTIGITKNNVVNALGYEPGQTNAVVVENVSLPISGFTEQTDGTYLYTIANDLVVEDTLVDAYFSQSCMKAGIKAGIVITSEAGYIHFHANKLPTEALVVETLRIINPSQDDSYNEDYDTELADLQNPTFEDYSSTTYSEEFDTSVGKIESKGVFSKILEGIKGSLLNLNTRLTSCNNDLVNSVSELMDNFSNYLHLTGGTLSGNLTIKQSDTFPTLMLDYTDSEKGSSILQNGTNDVIVQSGIDNVYGVYRRLVLFNQNASTAFVNSLQLQVKDTSDGSTTSYTIYGQHNPGVHYHGQSLYMSDGATNRAVITCYEDSDTASNYGANLVIGAAGNTYIGGGESASSLYTAIGNNTSEQMYVSADGSIALAVNCNTIANRKLVWLTSAAFHPATSGSHTLGTSSYKWGQIYSTASSISTSDANQKHDITDLDSKTIDFILSLSPKSYKFNDGTSGRSHWGLIAQDVELLMDEMDITSEDFAGFIKSPKEKIENEATGKFVPDLDEDGNVQYEYALRYEEFIAPLIKTVQYQQKEIEELKQEINSMKSLINN